MSGARMVAFIFAAAAIAAASVASCTHGNYDGSYDGGVDGPGGLAAAGGVVAEQVFQPNLGGRIGTSDGAFVVTMEPGTFTSPTTVTIAFGGERELPSTLIVPIYTVSASTQPTKIIQVDFHGGNNVGGGQQFRLVAAIETGGAFTPLPIVGGGIGTSPSGENPTFWGLSKTFGTFSLTITSNAVSTFAEVGTSSCMAKCCGGAAGGVGNSCYCAKGANDFIPTASGNIFPCLVSSCPDIVAAGARCGAIAAASNSGQISCGQGSCGPTGGAGDGPNACCKTAKGAVCVGNPEICDLGFAVRCNGASKCPAGTDCCVFESESYCAKDCPLARRACAESSMCAGTDGGTCETKGCPVGVCGTPPKLCVE